VAVESLVVRRPARARRRAALFTTVLLLASICIVPAAYWTAANFVPPFRYDLPAVPNPNGYVEAQRVIREDWGQHIGVAYDTAHHRRDPGTPYVTRFIGDRPPQWRDAGPGLCALLLRERAATLRRVRPLFRLQWRVPNPIAPDLRRGFDLRECAATFACESRLECTRGHYAAAMASALDAIELGSLACRGGSTHDRYIGQDSHEMGLCEAERAVWRLPRARLPELLGRVRRLRRDWPPVTETLEAERLEARRDCIEFLTGLSARSPWEQAATAEYAVSRVSTPPGQLIVPGWASWMQALTPRTVTLARLDRYYRDLAIASARPAPRGVPLPVLKDLWAARSAKRSWTGSYRGEWPRHNLALLETALAVRLHQAERGRLPRNVQEIDRRRLPEIPDDVWAQPIHYLVRRGRPVIYSLGPDGIDEHGHPVEPSTLDRADPGDSVFGMLIGGDWAIPMGQEWTGSGP
jgi:hypothetical protein